MHAKVLIPLHSQWNSRYYPQFISLDPENIPSIIRMINTNHMKTTSDFIPIYWKACHKWSQKVMPCGHPVTSSQSQCHWKRYILLEVNAVHKHGTYGRTWLKVCSSCSTFKFLQMPCLSADKKWIQINGLAFRWLCGPQWRSRELRGV